MMDRLWPALPAVFGAVCGTGVVVWGWNDAVLMESRSSFILGALYVLLLWGCVATARRVGHVGE